jgi:Virulence factor Evf
LKSQALYESGDVHLTSSSLRKNNMSHQELLEVQAVEKVDREYAENAYQKATDFFYSTPLELSRASGTDSIANSQGAVQFYLIGQQTNDPQWSGITNENQSNLLAMGGLVHSYMQRTYPTVNSEKLDINTWRYVIGKLPCLTVGSSQNKTYNNQLKGVSVSGEFLSLIAKAIITQGSSLLTDFNSYLQAMGNIVFSVNTSSQRYKVTSCTYQSYLISNGAGGYFDYGAIVLREIDFVENFMQLKSSCSKVDYVNINMRYTEIVSLVQTYRIRKGGPDYERFQNLINTDATNQFENANNFFNGGNKPQNDIKPQV